MAGPLEFSRLFEHLDKLNRHLEENRGGDVLQAVKVIQNEGEGLKEKIKGAKSRNEKKLEEREAEFKQLQDKDVKLGEEKDEASRQLDEYKFDQLKTSLAYKLFRRDEFREDRNVEKAQQELKKATEELQSKHALSPSRSKARGKRQHGKERVEASRQDEYKLDRIGSGGAIAHSGRDEQIEQDSSDQVKHDLENAEALLLNKLAWSLSMSKIRRKVKKAKERLQQAENQRQATRYAKKEEEKKNAVAKNRYYDVMETSKKIEEDMEKIRLARKPLRQNVALSAGACTELQSILGLSKSARANTGTLKLALEKEFANVQSLIPDSKRIINHRISAVNDRWQDVEKAIRANSEAFH